MSLLVPPTGVHGKRAVQLELHRVLLPLRPGSLEEHHVRPVEYSAPGPRTVWIGLKQLPQVALHLAKMRLVNDTHLLRRKEQSQIILIT